MSIRDMLMLGIGDTKDVGGSETTGTVMAKENALIKNTQKVIDHFEGEWLNNFGDGRMGDYVHGITPDKPMVDEYNRRVYYTDSFTVPAGKTMNPASSNGVIIWSRGDIVIDGTINLQGARDTSDDPAGLPQSVSIDGTNYALAVGGTNYRPKISGSMANPLCGDSGVIIDNSTDETIEGSSSDDGDLTYVTKKDGSVSGGATCIIKEVNETDITFYKDKNIYNTYSFDYVSSILGKRGTGAIVLIAAGTIRINGTINASGTISDYSRNGKAPRKYVNDYKTGGGGDILYAKGGGGCVTLIAKAIDRTGSILVSGGTEEDIPAGADNTETLITPEIPVSIRHSQTVTNRICKLTGGKGAPAYTCGSGAAGQIKEYILT